MDFPSGWQECMEYVNRQGNLKRATDGTRYVITPNGNWMHWHNFMNKYADK